MNRLAESVPPSPIGLARITDTDVQATLVSEVGQIRGTLPYMSPEQARGDSREINLRSDVYALGVILYQMMTGRFPYETQAVSLVAALKTIIETPPKPLQQSFQGASAEGIPFCTWGSVAVGGAERDRTVDLLNAIQELVSLRLARRRRRLVAINVPALSLHDEMLYAGVVSWSRLDWADRKAVRR